MKKSLDQFKLGKAQMNKLSGGDNTYNCFIFDMENGDVIQKDALVPDSISKDNCKETLEKELGDGFTVKCYGK